MRTLDQIFGRVHHGSDDMLPRSRRLTERNGRDIYFVPHHSVSRTIGAIEDAFFSTEREVCATGGCGPLTAGVDAYVMRQYAHWNTQMPFTTASWIDDQAITVEFANLALAYPWPVGRTAKYLAAEIAAAMHVELGMPLDLWHIVDHQTVYERGWGSYPTQCCGDDLRGDLPWIRDMAIRIVVAAQNPDIPEEITMTMQARYVYREAGGIEYMLLDDELPPLAGDPKQDGYRVSTRTADGEAYGVLAGTEDGAPLMALPRDKYVRTQEVARELAQQKRAARQAELVAAFKAAQVA